MKKILQALLCLFLCTNVTNAFAQATGFISIPDPTHTANFSVSRKTSSGYITLGQSGNGGGNHEVILWNANYQAVWTQNFATAAVSIWHDVIETNDGNFIAFGANQNHNGSCNIAIKISPAGAVLWQKEYYLTSSFLTAFCISKAAGNDPGFVFGGGACAASNFLVRCDANGNIVWQHQYYFNPSTGVQAVFTINAENDSYYLGGYVGSTPSNSLDAYLMKIDSAGNWISSNVVNEPTLPQIPSRTIKLSTGNYAMICGYNNNPNGAQLIYYFNSATSCIGGAKFSHPLQYQTTFKDLAEVSGGKTIVTGTLNDAPAKYLYMELDPYGSILWQKKSNGLTGPTFTGANIGIGRNANGTFTNFGACYSDGRSITVIDSTGAGYCNDVTSSIISSVPDVFTTVASTPVISGPNIQMVAVTNASIQFTVSPSTLCGTVGIENAMQESSLLSIYPNPANDQVTVLVDGKMVMNAQVVFWNVLGGQVLALKMTSAAIDISGLTAGVYLMEVMVDGRRMVQRVIKN
ncbi:MAG: T9SS type A sorting domain-containing protein [Bacteroidota bacterium]|nr:T9SS type A sorting domain-containing protein [Bacteroidota bacterium]